MVYMKWVFISLPFSVFDGGPCILLTLQVKGDLPVVCVFLHVVHIGILYYVASACQSIVTVEVKWANLIKNLHLLF